MGLEQVELIMKLEEVLGIDIPDEDAYTFNTVEDVTNYVFSKIYIDEIDGKEKAFNLVKEILIETFEVSGEHIKAETHFINDLGFG